jgi:predicted RNA-binding protein associated with RNAse of E/G family
VKLNIQGKETWRYPGLIVQQAGSRIILEAFFDRDDTIFHGMPLCRGDRFVETYYTDRWYNIFEIYSRADGSLRGWYCNVSTPARLEGGMLTYHDLALDLLVFPDGRQIVLDEDEFSSLELPAADREQALSALNELRACFKQAAEKAAC